MPPRSAAAAGLLQQAQTPGLAEEVLGQVIAQIDPLVAVLVQEKLEEVRMHDMCISEINNGELRIEEKNTSAMDVARRHTPASAQLTALEGQLNETQVQRQLEHANFSREVGEQQEVIKLLNDAILTMKNFYESAAAQALLQQPREEAPPAAEAAPAEIMPASANASNATSP